MHGRGRTCLLLPALARDEERECTTQESMFNYVRLSDGGAAPASDEMRSEVEILARARRRVLPAGPVDFGDADAITPRSASAIARVVPGLRGRRRRSTRTRAPSSRSPGGRSTSRASPPRTAARGSAPRRCPPFARRDPASSGS